MTESKIDIIRDFMSDKRWRTVEEIRVELELMRPGEHFPENGIQAHLRDLRKAKHGQHVVVRRMRNNTGNGVSEYQVNPPIGAPDPAPAATERFYKGGGVLDFGVDFEQQFRA